MTIHIVFFYKRVEKYAAVLDETTTTTSTTTAGTFSWMAAVLNGCSCVVNHADQSSPWIAAVCQDLQLSLPYTYANAYVTPAHSQAVAALADDRDVLVVQIVGSKQWKVYKTVAIPFPNPHEQVGKQDTLPVPNTVLNGPMLYDTILVPGDVLHLPRV
jgi:ribosomal protein L16 Arg81 hydroxylase